MTPTPDDILAAIAENPKLRARDLADRLGIAEARLLAARVGHGATRIAANPDLLIPAAEMLGEVMALTRNDHCVSEKVGRYANYHPGPHAAMVLNGAIDLRIFPAHWRHAFAVETPGEDGPRRSLQVFDAAGDAVHKIHLRATSDHGAWAAAVAGLATGEDARSLALDARKPVETPKASPERAEALRRDWAKMTDTHQFLRLVSKLKMNRLGAYRIAGAPLARPLLPQSVDAMLAAVQAEGVAVMVFVGNRGCIQILGGPIRRLEPMGPWQNVLDPGFNLHLRRDRIAEVWAVEKPTQRGPALSVEAFDAEGGLILQVFPVPKGAEDSRAAWAMIVAGLPAAGVPA